MAHDEIVLMKEIFDSDHTQKKKKVDQIALSSPFMRIPKMDVRVARDLIDTGIIEIYQLQGRSAESIFEEILKKPVKQCKKLFKFLSLPFDKSVIKDFVDKDISTNDEGEPFVLSEDILALENKIEKLTLL